MALTIGVAACGGGSDGPTVAGSGSAKTDSKQSSSTKGSTKGSLLAFSKCMRAHGLADFPDPSADGGIQIKSSSQPGSPSDLEPNSPKFQAAQQACKAFAPTMGTPAQQAARKASALKYSKCMRSHGIADFPDPNSSGGLAIKAGPGSDLDPNSALFQAADKACQKLMPGRGKGGSLNQHIENGAK